MRLEFGLTAHQAAGRWRKMNWINWYVGLMVNEGASATLPAKLVTIGTGVVFAVLALGLLAWLTRK